jgi:hypothetical protein
LLSRIRRRFAARISRCVALRPATKAPGRPAEDALRRGAFARNLRQKPIPMRRNRIIAHLIVLVALSGCVSDRPIHPYRLEGFPGAPIEEGLFPLRDGTRWTFADDQGRTLVLSTRREGQKTLLAGQTEEEAEIREAEGFVEILYGGVVVDRPLQLAGKVGDQWRAAGATYMAFGYDEIEILKGEKVRALVVAADRSPVRDLYWFARDLGWVRLRSERNGKTTRDARLIAFEAGAAD